MYHGAQRSGRFLLLDGVSTCKAPHWGAKNSPYEFRGYRRKDIGVHLSVDRGCAVFPVSANSYIMGYILLYGF